MPFEALGSEYTELKIVLETTAFGGVVAGVPGIKKVLGSDGPERDQAHVLDHFRKVSLKFNEAARIMEAAGLDAASNTAPAEPPIRKAAALKFLRHLYLVCERGSQQVWVLSIPKTYTHYPLAELLTVKTSHPNLASKLSELEEIFNDQTRKRFGEATMLGLAWCEAAKLVLSTARKDSRAMAKLRRWFAGPTTTTAELERTISDVHAGFKKVANTLNGNRVIITDMPSLRSDARYELTEAFILSMARVSERPRTIYIEKALFENYEISVLHDMKKNWARVLVHECSHIDARTEDKGYAYQGIEPGVDITPADAAVNADSWAFFAADCANALTDAEILRAFGGTGGRLVKQAKNWN